MSESQAVTVDLEDPQDLALRFTPLLKQISEYALLLDRDHRVVWANGALLSNLPGVALNSSFQDALNVGSRSAFGKVLQQLETKSTANVELHHPTPGGMKVVSYCFALAGDGSVAGLGVDRSRELEVVTQMAVLIEDLESEVNHRISLAQRLEELAITDGLTEIFNRRHFDELLRREWNRWQRYGTQFGLLLVDIDRFKSVNDTHGHQVGDEVLRRIAVCLKDVVRCEDMVARYGGEEFVVIAVGVGPEGSAELADRLLQYVRDARMPAPVDRATVSIGVATTETLAPRSPEHLLRLADDALYRAKEAGRDRIHVSGSEAGLASEEAD